MKDSMVVTIVQPLTIMQSLDVLFKPRSIAVVGAGANPASMGSRSLRFIREFGFSGAIYPVNPRGQTCDQIPGYRSLADISEPLDLCLVAVPAADVGSVIADCVAIGVPIAQIFSSGFGELSAEGVERGQELLRLCGGTGKTRLVGPNCLGTHSALGRLTFARDVDPKSGPVSVLTQSGGLGLDILHQAAARGLPIGKLVSAGNCLDLDPADFLTYYAGDPETGVIGLYLEGIKADGRFLSALRAAARVKPVVVLKGGRTALGSQSAASHTGALASEHGVWSAALAQAGALEVTSVDELLVALTALSPSVPLPAGRGAAIAGNGGGATVLATDTLFDNDLTLTHLSEEIVATLLTMEMPAGVTAGNPTDTPAVALYKDGGEGLGKVLSLLLQDKGVDGLIVHFNLLPFLNYDDPLRLAGSLGDTLSRLDVREKPIYIALRSIPSPKLEALRQRVLAACQTAGLPCFVHPSEAVRAMAFGRRRADWLNRCAEGKSAPEVKPDLAKARAAIFQAKALGYRLLPQMGALAVMDAFGIPHPPAVLATNASEAATAAAEMGFPVALKIESPDIIHKTEVGGVRLGLNSTQAVRDAFAQMMDLARGSSPEASLHGVLVQRMATKPIQEMICGLKRDPVFGPVLLLGVGGVLAELQHDVALRVLPAAGIELESMWQELRVAPLFQGYRGMPAADVAALSDLLLKVSAMAELLPDIAELDLNPLMVMSNGEGVTAVDCRILLR